MVGCGRTGRSADCHACFGGKVFSKAEAGTDGDCGFGFVAADCSRYIETTHVVRLEQTGERGLFCKALAGFFAQV